MDWSLFWSAFGAIGGTVGALATTAAVIVALWQTRYSNKKKLKVRISDNTTVVPAQGDISFRKDYISVTVTNIGNRNIKVCAWQVKLSKRERAQVYLGATVYGTMLADPWPILLAPEEQTTQYWDKSQFYAFVQHEYPCISRKKQNIFFLVRDSTGKEYQTKSPKTWQDYYIEAEEYLNAHP